MTTSLPGTTFTTETSTRTPRPKPKRKTPTERQVEALEALHDDALIARALDALFALNRRAKKIRDSRNEYRRASFATALGREIDAIYSLKDGFLEAMALSGRAKVYAFEHERPSGYECAECEREWWGSDPECFGCGFDGDPIIEIEEWYLLDCGGHYRFHQPSASDAVAALAFPIPPHDPNQPQREIPRVGLTIEAQRVCVRMATERLRGLQCPPPDAHAVSQSESQQGMVAAIS